MHTKAQTMITKSGRRQPFLGFSLLLVVLLGVLCTVHGAIPESTLRAVRRVNRHGPYIGVVVANTYEIEPFLRSPRLSPAKSKTPYLDVAGKRFRLGTIGEQKVIIVMTGLSMLNAGITTQLLLTLFDVKGIVHFAIAGNADPDRQIGDVVVPKYWAHTGLWNWQRYGDGPEDELPLESNGDYTRRYGNLNFTDFSVNNNNGQRGNNLLNSVWYQPEEVFPVTGTPDQRRHVLWVPVDGRYYELTGKLEGTVLESCVNGTTAAACLPRRPVVTRVKRGCTANVFVDNAAYREFLRAKFAVTAVDMETAAIALVALQHGAPFVAVIALSDLAGGGSARSNEAGVFEPLAAQNAASVAVEFISLLST